MTQDKDELLALQSKAEELFIIVRDKVKWDVDHDWDVVIGNVSSIDMGSETDRDMRVITISPDFVDVVPWMDREGFIIVALCHEIAHVLQGIQEPEIMTTFQGEEREAIFKDAHPDNLYLLQMTLIKAVANKIGKPKLVKDADLFVTFKRNVWPEIVALAVAGIPQEETNRILWEKAQSFMDLYLDKFSITT